MKKALSFILVLAMVLCMSVTAFAAGEQSGNMTVTVNVSDNTPSYTIKIPSNITLDPTKTDWQKATGTLGVKNVSNMPNNRSIEVKCQKGELKKANSTETIPYLVGSKDTGSTKDFYDIGNGKPLYYKSATGSEVNYDYDIAVKVESWANVTPGTYNGTVTFNFAIYTTNP